MREVVLTDSARRVYEKASPALQKRLDRCFQILAADPTRHPNIKRLKAQLSGYWRFRVGDYRVVYKLGVSRDVTIVLIAHRRDVYR